VCKVQLVDYLAKETHLKNELIKMGADVQNRRMRQRRLGIEKESVRTEAESAEAALGAVSQDFATIESKVINARSGLDSKKAQSASVEAELKMLEDGIAKGENAKAALRSKIEVLEESIKSYEGFDRGVKSVLCKKEEGVEPFLRIRGVLADLIKVEPGYEEAVSAYLQNDAQLVVVETEDDMRRIAEYLESNKLGKAGFIALETMRRPEFQLSEATSTAHSQLNPISQFVKCDPEFTCMVRHLFNNAKVAENYNFDAGTFVASRDTTFVSRSGLVFRNGKVTGGSVAESEGNLLFGRRERLGLLKTQLGQIEEQISRLGSERDEKSRLFKALVVEITGMEESARREEFELANIRVKKDGQEEAVRKLKDEVALLDSELGEIVEIIDEMTKKGEELNSELNNMEADKSQAQIFVDQSQSMISAKREEKERIGLEVATLRAEVQAMERDEENARGNLNSQEAVFFELEETLYTKNSLLKESQDRVKAMEEETSKLAEENESISSNLTALSEESVTLDSARTEALGKLSADEQMLKSKEKEIDSLRNESRDLDVKLTEIAYRKTNLQDRISQAYKVDLDVTHLELEDNIDWDAMRTQVQELKSRLDGMGPVNLVAIDEHKELEERYSFLTHQQEDLVNAKDSLLKAIQKINKTTKDLFVETFQKIQVEFKNFFRMLFGGGQAELVLIDEQDVLESGIEIIVRPPGKKLQNIMLLSGGEKAMTATALLFAIFKVRPSPFCVLDEIDAPLDESNVVRFASVLKEFLKISQFIIITHNKRTIELADVMYGITMQERGVSKIVSVKFMESTKKGPEEKADDAPATSDTSDDKKEESAGAVSS